jgi:hypothetical protein
MIKVPTSIENNGDEQQYVFAALRRRSFLAALSSAVQRHERHVEPTGPLPQAPLNPWQASSEEGRQSSDLLSSLRQTLPSSSTSSFSLLWRGVSLLYETRTTPGRVLNSSAVHQGRPGQNVAFALLWSALLSCYELLTGISIFYIPNLSLGYWRVGTRTGFPKKASKTVKNACEIAFHPTLYYIIT